MKLSDSNKKQLKEFEERKEPDLSNVYSFCGYEYITIHPMSDETEILTKLGLQPADCIKVDLYWLVENRVFFLQVNSNKFSENGRKELFTLRKSKNSLVYLEANLDVSFISKQTVEIVIKEFLTKGILTMNFQKKDKPEYVYLGELPVLI